MITRFAPSPTGPLHLGHAASALFAWEKGRAGRFLLRIEDIDPARCRPDYAAWIEEDLRWLGLEWNGPVRTQSQHLPEYRDTLDRLDAEGLLYPCFCTRTEIAASASAPHGNDAPIYPGTCRHLDPAAAAARSAAGEAHALRLDMTAALHRTGPLTWSEHGEGRIPCCPEAFGDVVLARKDAPASYHLCVTHDDAAQGVTLVTRGVDLRPATSVHRVLQTLLGWPEPAYAHHPLLRGPDGNRLAKRDGAPAIRDLRAAGLAPEDVRRRIREAIAS